MELINAFMPDNTLWALAFDSLSALFIAVTFFFIAFIAFRSLRNKGTQGVAAKATSLGKLLGITLIGICLATALYQSYVGLNSAYSAVRDLQAGPSHYTAVTCESLEKTPFRVGRNSLFPSYSHYYSYTLRIPNGGTLESDSSKYGSKETWDQLAQLCVTQSPFSLHRYPHSGVIVEITPQ
ncbi:MAG: hypothetical protein Q4C87_06285 [Actinomycetaceae bacterium]|nr:hypothetical protein [Actinomycetaceae bacterium]